MTGVQAIRVTDEGIYIRAFNREVQIAGPEIGAEFSKGGKEGVESWIQSRVQQAFPELLTQGEVHPEVEPDNPNLVSFGLGMI